ncbi:MAG TPA: carboxypeptidase regulatory-like domain-containing protein [Longimicrobiaceae bacterium]|nr:carboxypeptidase regulatory-like domain-containing protein [Longimicrobiaceae bacterium]
MRLSRAGRLACLALLLAAPAAAQSTVRGTVRGAAGEPVAGANVFLLPSLEGTATDSAGNFSLSTAQRGAATLVVQRLGFAERRLALTLPAADAV